MIPATWTRTTIGAVADVTSGGTPSRKVTDYWDGDVPWVTTSLIDFNTITETDECITQAGVRNSSAKLYASGTLLMAMFGQGVTRGKVAILGIDAAFNQACVAIVPKNETPSRFLFHNLAARYDEIRQLSNSGSQENLNSRLIKSISLDLPTPPEIDHIVLLADAWDCGIRQLADLIAAKVRFKQGLMQQLLSGKTRFPTRHHYTGAMPGVLAARDHGLTATAVGIQRGLTGASYDEGIPALPDCPEGWHRVRLGTILSSVQRPIQVSSESVYQLVTAKRYRGGIVARERIRGDQIKTPSQFIIKNGDFLISRRQIVHGACGLVPASLDGAVVSNEYSCLKAARSLDPLFFEYLTHTKYLQRTFYQSSVGVTVEKMIFRLDQWLKYEINLPLLEEQRAVVAVLSTLDREIVLLDQLQRTVTQQKKALMQKLLTGEIRVPPLDPADRTEGRKQ